MGNTNNEFLRHTLATIAYRFQKSVSSSADEFGCFNLGHGSRTPLEIVNHIYEVLKATREFILDTKDNKVQPENLSFIQEVERFNTELEKFDIVLIEKNLDTEYAKRLIQGPLSDILTHVGQIAMMSRLYGKPLAKERFASAPITVGTLSYF
tara:strand:+ start:5036 stop:5491 length:456 start_codon:yes stop_codon:yes gene_type:complete